MLDDRKSHSLYKIIKSLSREGAAHKTKSRKVYRQLLTPLAEYITVMLGPHTTSNTNFMQNQGKIDGL